MSATYEGFANSATFLTARYLKEDLAICQRIQSIQRHARLRADTMELAVAAVKVRKANVEDHLICGVVGNILYLDSWATGKINWHQIAKVFH